MSMVSCQRCQSSRILSVSAKCSDCCSVEIGETGLCVADGYVPGDMGIGGGDYIEFSVCLNCGQMQRPAGTGGFPLSKTELERGC